MNLTNDMKIKADDLVDAVDDDIECIYSQGSPDSTTLGTVTDEEWRDTWIEGTLREVVRFVVEASIEERNEGELRPLEALDPDNIEQVYVNQYPWRCPFMAVELAECPSYAQILTTTDAYIRTKPGLSGEWDACRFQVREAP